jgi:hypothetical protein
MRDFSIFTLNINKEQQISRILSAVSPCNAPAIQITCDSEEKSREEKCKLLKT